MAYIVLAAGAVMVLIGALAIVTGYPIIQIERGWATVIAGTSLLAGGLVTMALALVLRALMDLRHALVAPSTSVTSYAPDALPAMDPRIDPRTERSPEETLPPAPHREAAMLGAAAIATSTVAAFASHDANETRQGEAYPGETDAHDPEPQSDDAQPLVDYPLVHAHPLADSHALVDSDALVEESDPWPTPETREEAPRLDDWLDRAFADLPAPVSSSRSERFTSTQAPPEPHHVEPSPAGGTEDAALPLIERAPATQLHDDHVEPSVDVYAVHHHEKTHEAYAMDHAHADATPLAADEPTSAVIGRYEADGTSYTMYADGSIEAQSDAGIYRFASMSELKAFIEG